MLGFVSNHNEHRPTTRHSSTTSNKDYSSKVTEQPRKRYQQVSQRSAMRKNREMVQKEINNGLSVFHSPQKADIFILAVPTPFIKNASKIPTPDLSYLKNAALSIVKVLEEGNTIIIESTIPVGTTENIANFICFLLGFLSIFILFSIISIPLLILLIC